MPANYVLLERIELNDSAASVTFSNIPQTGYTDLLIKVSARSTSANNIYMTLNGSTTNYASRYLYGSGTAAASGNDTTRYVGTTSDSSNTANTFGNAEIYIPNYTSSNYKSVSADSVAETNATTVYSAITAQLWSNTAAITSISLFPSSGSYVQYSTFSLYGLAALGTTPVIAPKASGGNIIDFDGTYWIHTFNTSGTFTPQTSLSCDYLVVAGGGGGGAGNGGGGGGAGGLLTSTGFSVSSAATVTIGAGGAVSTDGNNSVFSSLTAFKGGKGGDSGANGTGGSGTYGSGGGAGRDGGTTGGIGTSGQGNNGGNINYPTNNGGSGGGGAGASGNAAVGENASSPNGNGGAGISNSYSGSAVTYAGGGGGSGAQTTPLGGLGGAGGGGRGAGLAAGSTAAVAGTINLGGGGGGGGPNGAVWETNGAAGGSGIVIIRYLA